MKTQIGNSEDSLRLLKQDFARDRLVEFARKGEEPPDTEMFYAHARSRGRQGPIHVGMAFCIVALASFAAAALVHWI